MTQLYHCDGCRTVRGDTPAATLQRAGAADQHYCGGARCAPAVLAAVREAVKPAQRSAIARFARSIRISG